MPQDYAEAMKWYRMSADQSYGLAQVNIGSMYWYGRGVAKAGDLQQDCIRGGGRTDVVRRALRGVFPAGCAIR